MKTRTKEFAIKTIRFTDKLNVTRSNNYMIGQLIRAATSVGANYRAALRAKSDPDFTYKIKVIVEEADECVYWLELIHETNNISDEWTELYKEANELTAIFTATSKTLKIKSTINKS